MKKYRLLVVFILIGGFAFSQQDSIAVKPDSAKEKKEEKKQVKTKYDKGDFGFVLNMTGLINNINLAPVKDGAGNDQILFKYFLEEDIALRAGLGLRSWNNKWSTVDSVAATQVHWDSTYKKFDFYFAPGIEKHFKTVKKLDTYIGTSLEIGKLGRAKMHSLKTTTDTLGSATKEITADITGNYSAYLNFIAGFNYFISKKLTIGAEYMFGYGIATSGGDVIRVTIDTPVSGSKTIKRELSSDIVKSSGFRLAPTASITISYYFSL
jgi:hypothetical protein